MLRNGLIKYFLSHKFYPRNVSTRKVHRRQRLPFFLFRLLKKPSPVSDDKRKSIALIKKPIFGSFIKTTISLHERQIKIRKRREKPFLRCISIITFSVAIQSRIYLFPFSFFRFSLASRIRHKNKRRRWRN